MTTTDFRNILSDLIEQAGDFPVMFWADGESMPIAWINEDGDDLVLCTTTGEPRDSMLASDIIAEIDAIGEELSWVLVDYTNDEGSFNDCISDVSADTKSRTIDLCVG